MSVDEARQTIDELRGIVMAQRGDRVVIGKVQLLRILDAFRSWVVEPPVAPKYEHRPFKPASRLP